MTRRMYNVVISICSILFAVSMLAFLTIMFCNHYVFAATVSEVPNDVYYEDQWAMHGEYGIDIEGAWAITKGSESVRVGIIDSGINDHEDIDSTKLYR